jgi:anti-sigma factor ChrR (cupin superfamily)
LVCHPERPLFLGNFHELTSFSRAFPFELNDVFHFADHQNEIAWEPYKKGVDIFRLYGDGITGPTAALVRYRERGEVPMNEHKGYEHILILAGSQRDENGTFEAGAFAYHTHCVIDHSWILAA